MTLKEALEVLSTTYQSLDAVARGLVVDPAEVAAALKESEPDSAEEICLQYLAKYNPYVPPKTKG